MLFIVLYIVLESIYDKLFFFFEKSYLLCKFAKIIPLILLIQQSKSYKIINSIWLF